MNKTALMETLYQWINKRPGLEPRNYIRDWSDQAGRRAYFSDARSITRDLHHARALLDYISRRDSITAEDILKASKDSFSGRLTINPAGDGFSIDYCTGQYWPMEYRRAVAVVAASAIWDRLREDLPPDSKGDAIRKAAKRELGNGLSARFFN